MKKKTDKLPDLGDGDYEVKMTQTAKGQEIKEFVFRKKEPEKPMPGQYL